MLFFSIRRRKPIKMTSILDKLIYPEYIILEMCTTNKMTIKEKNMWVDLPPEVFDLITRGVFENKTGFRPFYYSLMLTCKLFSERLTTIFPNVHLVACHNLWQFIKSVPEVEECPSMYSMSTLDWDLSCSGGSNSTSLPEWVLFNSQIVGCLVKNPNTPFEFIKRVKVYPELQDERLPLDFIKRKLDSRQSNTLYDPLSNRSDIDESFVYSLLSDEEMGIDGDSIMVAVSCNPHFATPECIIENDNLNWAWNFMLERNSSVTWKDAQELADFLTPQEAMVHFVKNPNMKIEYLKDVTINMNLIINCIDNISIRWTSQDLSYVIDEWKRLDRAYFDEMLRFTRLFKDITISFKEAILSPYIDELNWKKISGHPETTWQDVLSTEDTELWRRWNWKYLSANPNVANYDLVHAPENEMYMGLWSVPHFTINPSYIKNWEIARDLFNNHKGKLATKIIHPLDDIVKCIMESLNSLGDLYR